MYISVFAFWFHLRLISDFIKVCMHSYSTTLLCFIANIYVNVICIIQYCDSLTRLCSCIHGYGVVFNISKFLRCIYVLYTYISRILINM